MHFSHENAFENVWKMATILFRPKYVDKKDLVNQGCVEGIGNVLHLRNISYCHMMIKMKGDGEDDD